VPVTLDAAEARVLGALLEKDLATPEYYPLSQNALVAACNQKHNREPVVNYDEETVHAALEGLRQRRLAAIITGAGLRVPKFRHLMGEAFNLGRRELAVLTVLLLRGPQTLGELRDRTERMHGFTDVEEVESVLHGLSERPDPLAVLQPRQPGTKEPRWRHLLGDERPAEPPAPSRADRIDTLEAEIERLRADFDELRTQFAAFRKQFD
jgi:uncharacterized protein YceH (UPF0502 family)